MELSESAKLFTFSSGEYKDQKPSELLNHYLLIMHLAYELTRNLASENEKKQFIMN